VAEHVPATITLPADGARTVHVLDSAGTRVRRADAKVDAGRLTLTVRPGDDTLLYEVAKD
jgi:hypothetical protein